MLYHQYKLGKYVDLKVFFTPDEIVSGSMDDIYHLSLEGLHV